MVFGKHEVCTLHNLQFDCTSGVAILCRFILFLFYFLLFANWSFNCTNLRICIYHLKSTSCKSKYNGIVMNFFVFLLILELHCYYWILGTPRLPYWQFKLWMLPTWLVVKFQWTVKLLLLCARCLVCLLLFSLLPPGAFLVHYIILM